MPVSVEQFVDSLSITGLMTTDELKTVREGVSTRKPPPDVETLAKELVKAGKLTKFQANAIYQGKGKGLVCGEYVLLEKIGAGGMGQVFKARHKRMNRIVAVKLLAPHTMIGDKGKAVKRFYQEVETAARLLHPNIVVSYDAGESNGLHYLVMEHVEGQDLSTALKPDKKLPLDQALGIILQAAKGLQYAHEQGIVHRDIKPSNLLMDRKGNVKVLDMGLARVEDALTGADRAAGEGLTQTGEVMGTVDYMAPEQARNTRDADARADIYSLGCTLYRLTAGRVVFDGQTMVDKILAHHEKPVPSLAKHCQGVTPRLEHAFTRMLAKKPEQRFQTMSDVIAELEACRAGVPEEEHAPLVTDEPPVEHGMGSFLTKASGTGLSRKQMPLPPAPQDSAELAAAQLNQPESPGHANRRVWLFAGGGLATLVLIGTLIALLMRDRSQPTPPVAQADPAATIPDENSKPPDAGNPSGFSKAFSPGDPAAKPSVASAAKAAPNRPANEPTIPPTADPPTPIPAEGIDLLKLVDLKRDVVEGSWKVEDSALVVPVSYNPARVQFPYAPPPEYDLHVEAELFSESVAAIGLVVGSSRAVFYLNQKGKYTSLGQVDGTVPSKKENPARVEGATGFDPGQPLTIVTEVRPTSVRVTLNGQEVVNWQGNSQRLSASGAYVGQDQTKLFLYVMSGARFTQYELLPPGGQSRRIPPAGIDLLKLVDLKRDVGEGTWNFEGSALAPVIRDETGREVPSRLQLPYAPPPEYDLHVELETFSLSQLGIGLVVGSSRAMFLMSQQLRKTSLWQGDVEADQNPTLVNGAAGFAPGQPMAIVCQVRPTSILVTLNGQTVVDWKGDPQKLSVPSRSVGPDKTRLFLYSFRGVRIKRYEVLPPGGVPRPRPSPTPTEVASMPAKSGVRVNLLRLIDPKRDGLTPNWTFEGAALLQIPGHTTYSNLQIPYVVPREYELRVVVEPRTPSNGDLAIGLVVGSSSAAFVVDRSTKSSGLEAIQGKSHSDNETTVQRLPGSAQGQPMSIVCQVRPTDVRVTLNGQRVVDWHGDPRQLSTYGNRRGADKSKLFLAAQAAGSSTTGSFRITKLELVPLGGQAAPIPATEAIAAALPKAQELIGELPKNATAAQRVDAAIRLHEQAAAAADDAMRYAMLTEALKLATIADDLNLALYLLEDLARCFQVDANSLLNVTFNEIAARTRPPNDRKELLFKFLEAADEQIAAERYDTASLLMKSASAIVGKLTDAELKKEVRNRELEVEEGQKLFAAAEPARQTLSAKPDDANANSALGKYLIVARHDWDAALAHLSKGSDSDLRAAAKTELQAGKDPGRAAEIGNAWLDAAEKATVPAKVVLLERSHTWLARGTAGLSKAALAKLNTRYKKVDADVRRVAGTAFVKRHPLRALAFGGHWYQLLPEHVSWYEARQRCHDLGGELVCLETPPEAQWVHQFAMAQHGKPEVLEFWIGATEEGHDRVFTWVNGSPMQFTDWASGYPHSDSVREAVYAWTEGTKLPKWYDGPPTGRKLFICEWDR